MSPTWHRTNEERQEYVSCDVSDAMELDKAICRL